jgi:uncharacterized membrane protein HdeD (DUF308 family)
VESMNAAPIIMGIFAIIVGVINFWFAETTPEGELVDRKFGEYWTHERSYFEAVLCWVFGAVLICIGIFVS